MRFVHDPFLLWLLFFAYLCTVVSWPASTWRGWVQNVVWLITLIVILLHYVR
jgi:hypothetical protein